MDPNRVEKLGIALVVLAVAAAVASCWVLAGWPWALALLAVLAGAGGVLLVYLAALMPEPKRKAGESK